MQFSITGTRSRAYRRRSPGPVFAYIESYLHKAWDAAIAAFAEAVAHRVLVDSGMTGASLFAVAAEVRKRNVIKSIILGKGPSPKKGHKENYGWSPDNTGPYKSMAFGERLGKDAYSVSYGSRQRVLLKFEFNIVVFQHALHEHGGRYNLKATESLAAGAAAFRETFNAYISSERFAPDRIVMDYLRSGRLPVELSDA